MNGSGVAASVVGAQVSDVRGHHNSVKVNFAHICDYATISREGKLSVLGIFDRLLIPNGTVPVQHPQMYFAFELEFDRHEVGRTQKLEVRLADEDGGILFQVAGELAVELGPDAAPGRPLHAPQIVTLIGLTFRRLGVYGLDIFVNDRHAYNRSFQVAPLPTGNSPKG